MKKHSQKQDMLITGGLIIAFAAGMLIMALLLSFSGAFSKPNPNSSSASESPLPISNNNCLAGYTYSPSTGTCIASN